MTSTEHATNTPALSPEKQKKILDRHQKKQAAAAKANKQRYHTLKKSLGVRRLTVLICDEDREAAKLALAPFTERAERREFEHNQELKREKLLAKAAALRAELNQEEPEDPLADLSKGYQAQETDPEINRSRMDDFAKDVPLVEPVEKPAPAQPPAWKQTEIPPKAPAFAPTAATKPAVRWQASAEHDDQVAPGLRDQAPAQEKVLTTVPDMTKNFEGRDLKFHTTRKG